MWSRLVLESFRHRRWIAVNYGQDNVVTKETKTPFHISWGWMFFTPRSKMSKIQTYFETFPQEEKEICRNGNFTQLENKKDLRLMPRVSRLLPLPCHRYIHTWYYRCVPLFHGYRIKKKVYQHKILWYALKWHCRYIACTHNTATYLFWVSSIWFIHAKRKNPTHGKFSNIQPK